MKNRTLDPWKARILNALGAETLSNLFLSYAMLHLCYNLYANLQGQYISTLFMRSTGGDGDIVKYYNMIAYAMNGVSMCIASAFVRKRSVTAGTQVGLLLYITGTGLFLVFMRHLAPVMPLIALVNATGGGFYWIAYSMILSAYTEDNNRDKAMGFLSVLCGFVTMVIPLVSGLILTAFGGSMAGYYLVFGMAFAMAVFTLLLSRKQQTLLAPARETHFKQALKAVFSTPLWRLVMAAELFKGIREGTFAFFLNLLLFSLVSNEAVIGVNTVLVSIVSIFAASLIGRLVRPGNRIKSMLTSVTVMMAGIVMLFVSLNPVTIILFNILNSFVSLFLLNPAGSIFLMVVQKARGAREMQSEIFGIREVWLNVGRIIGIVVTMVMPQSTLGNVSAMCILTALQYVMVLCYSKVMKKVEQG